MQIIISLNGPNNILPVETELRDYLLASKNNSILEKILNPLLLTFERNIPLNIIMGEKDWRYRDWVLNKTENLFDNVNIFYAKNCITQIQSIDAFINNTTLNETDDFLVIPKDTIISKSFFDKIKKNKHLIELGLGTFRSNNPKYGYNESVQELIPQKKRLTKKLQVLLTPEDVDNLNTIIIQKSMENKTKPMPVSRYVRQLIVEHIVTETAPEKQLIKIK